MPETPRQPDAFDALGLSPSFDLDEAAIRRAWLARAGQAHPDLAGDEGAPTAAELNEARATLAAPERRANALLARLGGPSKEDDNALPDGFLMEMMEVREELEAAHASGDPAQTQRLRDWADDQRATYIERVSGLFKALAAPPPPEALADIRRELNAWRYIERMIEQIDPDHDAVM